MPDLRKVPELDPGIVAPGLKAVITFAGGDWVERDQEVPLSADPGPQPPGPVPARRALLAGGREGEPWPVPGSDSRRRIGAVPRPGLPMFLPVPLLVLGFRPSATVADGVPVLVGHGYAERGPGVLGGGAGQVAGDPRVNGADAGDLAGPVGQVEQGGQRDDQVDLPGEPGRDRPGRWSARGRAARGWSGAVLARIVLAGAGVSAEEHVQVGAGPQLVHRALQAGLL